MKELLAWLGRLCMAGYGRSLIGFLIAQVAFVLAATNDWLPKCCIDGGIDRAQTAFLLLSVHALVVVNTVVFLLNSSPIVSTVPRIEGLDSKVRSRCQQDYQAFMIAGIIATFISGMLGALSGLSWLGFLTRISWDFVLELNDGLCILLFFLFFLADMCCLRLCETAMGNASRLPKGKKAEIQHYREEVRLFVLACDGPGLIGIIVIFVISTLFHPMVSGLYWHGFVAGAIGLHIAFSQAVLAFLSARK